MPARLIDGRAVAAALRHEVAAYVAALPYRPRLAVVLVGDDPASAVYVRTKDRAAEAAGIHARTIRLPAATAEAELLALVGALNADPGVDGILVQMPLPPHICTEAIIDAIDPARDVDGLTPRNAGLLAHGKPFLAPCTPAGIMRLLAATGVRVAGARAVVLGRSVLVGRPMAALLTNADATVTLVHSRTQDAAAECRRADIVVAAVGRPGFVRGDWVAEGATVVDVGINRLADGTLAGDVDFFPCAERAGHITPVPGGVGPMTIACLLDNTVTAATARRC